MALSDLLPWLSFFAIAITAIGVFLGPYLAERWSKNKEARKIHLDRIRNDVILPLLKQIADHYEPILGFKTSNIQLTLRTSRRTISSVTEQALFSEWEVAATGPYSETRYSNFAATDQNRVIDKELYEDARGNHFKDLLTRWDAFEAKARNFNTRCLQLAELVAEEVRNQGKLELSKQFNVPGRWAQVQLGKILYERMLGWGSASIASRSVNYPEGTLEEVDIGGQPVAQVKRDELAPFTKIVDDVIAGAKEKLEEIKEEANSLLPELIALKVELETVEKLQDLPGKCKFLR